MSTVVPAAQTLGSVGLYEVLFRRVFASGEALRESDVRTYCIGSYYRAGSQLDGAIGLLTNIGALEFNDGRFRPGSYFDSIFRSENLGLSLSLRVIHALSEANELEDVFVSGSLSGSRETKDVYVHCSRIPLEHIALLKFLRDCGSLEDVEGSPALMRAIAPLSDTLVAQLVSSGSKSRNRKPISPEQLEKIFEAQKRQGDLAERFVLEYERKRLKHHARQSAIKRISLDDTGAGYDIISFSSIYSLVLDRYIEVKSFSDVERFFWSSREVDVAEELQEYYFLYLVDMNRIEEADYEPKVIVNPHKDVFSENARYKVGTDTFVIELNLGYEDAQQ
jgi:uncharacterized protein DUF3883